MINKRIKLERAKRIRAKLGHTLPRLSVFRSNKYIFAQIIDDQKRETLAAVFSKNIKREENERPVDIARKVGKLIAELTLKKKISKVVFDRGGYKYHGQVKAVSEGAREGGLKF